MLKVNILSCSMTSSFEVQDLLFVRSLCDHMILTHKGHQGLGKNKILLRGKGLVPGIDSFTETCIKSCSQCQSAVLENHISPPLYLLCPHLHGWKLGWIFVRSLMENIYWLIENIDNCSHYPEVEMDSTTSPTPLYLN